MERIERIKEMEQAYDEGAAVLEKLAAALEEYLAVKPRLDKLEEYYQGPLWLADFDADRVGLVPKNLKRGILTEDAIYDLMIDRAYLLDRMKKLTDQKD